MQFLLDRLRTKWAQKKCEKPKPLRPHGESHGAPACGCVYNLRAQCNPSAAAAGYRHDYVDRLSPRLPRGRARLGNVGWQCWLARLPRGRARVGNVGWQCWLAMLVWQGCERVAQAFGNVGLAMLQAAKPPL